MSCEVLLQIFKCESESHWRSNRVALSRSRKSYHYLFMSFSYSCHLYFWDYLLVSNQVTKDSIRSYLKYQRSPDYNYIFINFLGPGMLMSLNCASTSFQAARKHSFFYCFIISSWYFCFGPTTRLFLQKLRPYPLPSRFLGPKWNSL